MNKKMNNKPAEKKEGKGKKLRTIQLNHITKIEGHAKLNLQIENGAVKVCELSATEGARYFEGLVRGRKYFEAQEITSRICGICSTAHVVAAVLAIEDALGFEASEQTTRLRELITLGERIRSHATHLYFLALPDYLGYESAIAMASKYKNELKIALSLMKLGNDMIKVLAARDLHPVSVAVGGWLHLPKQEDVLSLVPRLKAAKADAVKTCKLFSSLHYPKFESECEWYSLVRSDTYSMFYGNFASGRHLFEQHKYMDFMQEYHEPYSSANFVVRDGHRYMVGALPRLNNNHQQLSPDARKMLKASPLKKLPSLNPYLNNVAQAIELVHCIDQAIRMCSTMKIKPEAVAHPKLRAGRGIAAVEAPRGTLWHEYVLNDEGVITSANIVTPTAQNLLNMQEDIRCIAPALLHKKKEDLIMDVEKLIRSYDPCFSCSAHFLEVNLINKKKKRR